MAELEGVGDVLLLHDGHARRDAQGRPVVLTLLPRLLARLREAGLKAVALDQAVPLGHGPNPARPAATLQDAPRRP